MSFHVFLSFGGATKPSFLQNKSALRRKKRLFPDKVRVAGVP
jgi:hypothetical protein